MGADMDTTLLHRRSVVHRGERHQPDLPRKSPCSTALGTPDGSYGTLCSRPRISSPASAASSWLKRLSDSFRSTRTKVRPSQLAEEHQEVGNVGQAELLYAAPDDLLKSRKVEGRIVAQARIVAHSGP